MFLLLVNHLNIYVKIISYKDKFFFNFSQTKKNAYFRMNWSFQKKNYILFFHIPFHPVCMCVVGCFLLCTVYRNFHDGHALNLFNFISYLYFALLLFHGTWYYSQQATTINEVLYIFIFPNLWRVSCVHCMAHRNSYYLKAKL